MKKKHKKKPVFTALTILLLVVALVIFITGMRYRKPEELSPRDQGQIENVLKSFVPANSAVKSFEIGDLEIKGKFAKAIIVPKDVETDPAFVILKKDAGEWKVIWGPGTDGYSDIEGLPKGL